MPKPPRQKLRMYTGMVDLFDPQPDEIRILDIAHHLAGLCRWTGGTVKHYSVAQHSGIVADNVPQEMKLVALLHDAAEAYLGDTPAPIAALRSRTERAHEERFLRVIGVRFGIDLMDLPPPVIEADLRARSTERRDILRAVAGDMEEVDPRYPPFEARIQPVSRELAMNLFLGRFKDLAPHFKGPL